ncbi:ATP-binding protein [Lentzea sp. PSKA42]|uniref:ATP-binding protein n=1 Tax=Lentzea indica TaxID=2604800 RepID=A0ABX1FV02_9PSEU|nr:ATP-binding protein [Lentzea indica]NKE62873.1 ATP-binding protein [Lentzea indica]
MTPEERKALAALRFNWALTPDDVWGGAQFHVEGLHTEVEKAVVAGLEDAQRSTGSSPIGLVIQGQKGVGKTHLLGWVRERVQETGGYFFLVKLMEGNAFWTNTANAIIEGLVRPGAGGRSQVAQFLDRLSSSTGTSVTNLDEFVGSVRRLDRAVWQGCQDTLRALVLFASPDDRVSNIGDDYLSGMPETNPGDREARGIRPHPKQPQEIVGEVSKLLALTGPMVVAVDQIDQLVAVSTRATGESSAEDDKLFALVGEGLMSLRDNTSRTLSVVACLPHTWELLRSKAVDTVADRFRTERPLSEIPNGTLARALVEKRLSVIYRELDFTPPSPTWPISKYAFAGMQQYTPRKLLQRIDEHARWCLLGDAARDLERFDAEPEPVVAPPPPTDLSELDRLFEELRAAADVRPALDQRYEDEVMPGLLSAALTAWIAELGENDQGWSLESPPSVKPALHARLIRTLDEDTENEAHWAFRAIAAPHHRAALSRLSKARSAAAHHLGSDRRRLILLRNQPWSSGPVTQQSIAAFREAGGRDVPVSESDLRTFAALKEMLTAQDPRLPAWLMARKPASDTELLAAVLPTVFPAMSGRLTAEPADISGVPVGTVDVDLATLREHVFICAGTGSGKTVLLRRLVEECALRGVSAIVLDPNNDLARLGDTWPTPPPRWGSGDADRARAYLEGTDVVVWTPNRQSGRPLCFQPLPDFASLLDNPDEFEMALDVAVSALAPRAGVASSTAKNQRSKAVLRDALKSFASTGKRELAAFVDLLAGLPNGVTDMANARAMAGEMAETLKATMINDRLFAGTGEPVDPALLLTPSSGAIARVSVISFVGLPSDEQRQSFVSQLQMELFAWVKRNPVQSLGWLLVMDEAQTLAPSGKATTSTASTQMLAAQARKYGLGLVFATQAPKGLDNRISGNATTQIFGRLSSPAQIRAAEEVARAKGSAVPDIARLTRGEFFVATDATGFHLTTVPMCLSHHPPSPLTADEVIDRARR